MWQLQKRSSIWPRRARPRATSGSALASHSSWARAVLHGRNRPRRPSRFCSRRSASFPPTTTPSSRWSSRPSSSESRGSDPDLHSLAAERLERLTGLTPATHAGQNVVLANLASEAARSGTSNAEAVELAERALAGGSLMREHFDPGVPLRGRDAHRGGPARSRVPPSRRGDGGRARTRSRHPVLLRVVLPLRRGLPSRRACRRRRRRRALPRRHRVESGSRWLALPPSRSSHRR